MTGFAGTFGSNTDETNTGDNQDYPIDQQMRVLQAVSPDGHAVLATLVNFSTHPTIYGPRNQVAPDWPGATATYLEHDEQDMPAGARYGYPGSTAIVTIGAVGHSWPAGIPASDTDRGRRPGGQGAQPGARTARARTTGRPTSTATRSPSRRSTPSPRPTASTSSSRWSTGRAARSGWRTPTRCCWRRPTSRPTTRRWAATRSIARPPRPGATATCSSPWSTRCGSATSRSTAFPASPTRRSSSAWTRTSTRRCSSSSGWPTTSSATSRSPRDYNGAFQCSTTDEWFFTISPRVRRRRGAAVPRQRQERSASTSPGSALSAYGPGAGPALDQLHRAAGRSRLGAGGVRRSRYARRGGGPARPRCAAAAAAGGRAADPAALVNPLNGTLGPGFPTVGAGLPFGMIQPGPDTALPDGSQDPVNYTGYSYQDPDIRGFSLTHFDGAGIQHRRRPAVHAHDRPGQRRPTRPGNASPYVHASETAQPGYYAVTLARSGTRAELTGTLAGGDDALHLPQHGQANVLAEVSQSINGAHPASVTRRRPPRAPGLGQVRRRLQALLRRGLRPAVHRRRARGPEARSPRRRRRPRATRSAPT